jgi:uncharacterized protein
MKSKILSPSNSAVEASESTFALIFETEDEVISGLKAFAVDQGVAASRFTAIGAFKDALLGYSDLGEKGI